MTMQISGSRAYLRNAASSLVAKRGQCVRPLAVLPAYLNSKTVSTSASGRSLAGKRSFATFRTQMITSYPFLNRESEMATIHRFLNGQPRFTVVSGPPSSGKTMLLREILQSTDANGKLRYNSKSIDLRQVCVETQGNFQEELARKTFIPGITDTLGSIAVGIEGVEMKTSKEFLGSEGTFNNLIESIADDGRPRVFVLDEANRLMTLAETDFPTYNAFIASVVQVSKQDRKVHVVFTTSDSFFLHYLNEQSLASRHVVPFYLGDLNFEHAYQYYLQTFKRLYPEKKDSDLIDRKTFTEKVFRLTGGRPIYLEQYAMEADAITNDIDFRLVSGALSSLKQEFHSCPRHAVNSSEQLTYTQKDLLMVFQLLTNSEGNYVDYDLVVSKCSKPVVDKMIQKNILHYRGFEATAEDLIPPPVDAVVTAAGVPDLRAMELLLKKLSAAGGI